MIQVPKDQNMNFEEGFDHSSFDLPPLPPKYELINDTPVEDDDSIDYDSKKGELEAFSSSTSGVSSSASIVQIEKILNEDLDYIYKDLPPKIAEEFKIKEAQTAEFIDRLMSKSKINIKKIIKSIIEWLKIIPGINKFFLEQEAKIKADKILHLSRNQE